MKMPSLGAALLAVAVAAAGEVPSGKPAASPPSAVAHALRPKPLEGLSWAGPQFLEADRKGRVFLLRGGTLEVYPVAAGVVADRPQELVEHRVAVDPTQVLAASMSADGGRWLLWCLDEPRSLLLYESGKEKILPSAQWLVSSVGFAGSDPLLAVAAVPVDRRVEMSAEWEPPLLLSLAGMEWRELAREEVAVERGGNFFQAAQDARALVLARGAESTFWAARRHAYHLRHFSGGGRVLEEVAVGDATPEYRDRTEGEQALLDAVAVERARLGRPLAGRRSEQVAMKVIQAIAWAPKGQLYLLIASEANEGKGPALDRYDSVRGVLERVDLGLESYTGRQTLAAGSDGLYLANYQGDAGRWWLPWEALDAAKWREVPSARMGSALGE